MGASDLTSLKLMSRQTNNSEFKRGIAVRTILVLILFSSFLTAQVKPKTKDFPTDDEIRLVVLQAERAFAEYKQAVALEESLPTVKKDKTSLDTDRHLIELYPRLLEALKANTSKFNGLAGLLLLTTIDDASRNAALCSNTGMTDIGQELLANRDTSTIYQMLTVSQKCVDVSTHLYTVSESVNALFVKATEAQEDLSEQAMDTLDKCAAAIKATGKR
jgi:hypothetical protein